MTAPTSQDAELSPECAEWVLRVVDAAPPLTDEQRTRLAELLRPARPQCWTAATDD